MTLILELEPELERQLARDATQANMTVEAWTLQLLKTQTTPSHETQNGLDQAEIARRVDAWKEFGELAREYSKDAPPLSDYAISREGIYDYELERNL